MKQKQKRKRPSRATSAILAHIKEQAKRDTQVIFSEFLYLRTLYGE